jgi:flagellin FlaB
MYNNKPPVFRSKGMKISKICFNPLENETDFAQNIYVIKTFCQSGILEDPVSMIKEGKIMHSSKRNDEGFTGLEAAIVLIAFVVVAAVFSYVVLGAGFFTTQKAQETIYKGVEQSTSNLMITGTVFGLSEDNATITTITFPIGLAPGASAIDLSTLKIGFSTPDTLPVTLTQGTTKSLKVFTTTVGGNATLSLSPNQQVDITFEVSPISPTTIMNFELKPVVGANLRSSRPAPAKITRTNILT